MKNESSLNKSNESFIKSDSIKSQKTCLVCFENQSNVVFLDCGHGGLCLNCAKKTLKNNCECHLCRKNVTKFAEIDLDVSVDKNYLIKNIWEMKNYETETFLIEFPASFIKVLENSEEKVEFWHPNLSVVSFKDNSVKKIKKNNNFGLFNFLQLKAKIEEPEDEEIPRDFNLGNNRMKCGCKFYKDEQAEDQENKKLEKYSENLEKNKKKNIENNSEKNSNTEFIQNNNRKGFLQKNNEMNILNQDVFLEEKEEDNSEENVGKNKIDSFNQDINDEKNNLIDNMDSFLENNENLKENDENRKENNENNENIKEKNDHFNEKKENIKKSERLNNNNNNFNSNLNELKKMNELVEGLSNNFKELKSELVKEDNKIEKIEKNLIKKSNNFKEKTIENNSNDNSDKIFEKLINLKSKENDSDSIIEKLIRNLKNQNEENDNASDFNGNTNKVIDNLINKLKNEKDDSFSKKNNLKTLLEKVQNTNRDYFTIKNENKNDDILQELKVINKEKIKKNLFEDFNKLMENL